MLKDIVIKSKTLSGFDAPYIPGWDCHGLPIELQVEKNWKQKENNLSEDLDPCVENMLANKLNYKN